eukprot:2056363-Rhodomonas_salina.2
MGTSAIRSKHSIAAINAELRPSMEDATVINGRGSTATGGYPGTGTLCGTSIRTGTTPTTNNSATTRAQLRKDRTAADAPTLDRGNGRGNSNRRKAAPTESPCVRALRQ